jgi:hypothetical protein
MRAAVGRWAVAGRRGRTPRVLQRSVVLELVALKDNNDREP